MTISVTTATKVYNGNGATTNWAVPFTILNLDTLVVQRMVKATGEIDKTYTPLEYSTSNLPGTSGTVTISPALASTYQLVISRVVEYTQELDIINSGGFYPESLEQQLDKIVMQIQQLAERVARAWTFSPNVTGVNLPQLLIGDEATGLVEDDMLIYDGTNFIPINLSGFTGPAGADGEDGTDGAAGPAAWQEPEAWATSTVYTADDPKSVVTKDGSTYVCIVSHTSDVFATDLAAARWILIAAKGSDGAGSGDMLAANNLSDVADLPTALSNLGILYAAESDIWTGTSTARIITPKEMFDAAAPVTLTDAATIAVDMATGINFNVTLEGNRTLGNPTNAKVGQSGRIRITQDATGSRTLAYAANWKHIGAEPAPDETANAVNLYAYFVNATDDIELTYLGVLV